MQVSTPKTEGKLMHHALRATPKPQKYYNDSLNQLDPCLRCTVYITTCR